jgi:hypothetical protein
MKIPVALARRYSVFVSRGGSISIFEASVVAIRSGCLHDLGARPKDIACREF